MPTTKERTYNDAEIAERLKELPGWYHEDGWIRRVYKTDGWPTTIGVGRASDKKRHPLLAVYSDSLVKGGASCSLRSPTRPGWATHRRHSALH